VARLFGMTSEEDDIILERMLNPSEEDAILIMEILIEHLIEERGFSIEDLRALLPRPH
jgi:hypothetical protein